MGGRKRRRKSAGEGLCALLLPEDVFAEGVLGEKSFRRTSCKARWRSDVCYVVDVNSEHPVPQQRIYKKKLVAAAITEWCKYLEARFLKLG